MQIASAPSLTELAGEAEVYTALAVVVAVWALYFLRLRRASRPQRRALVAVAVTSLLFLPAYFVTNFAAWVLDADRKTVENLAWAIVATRVLLPLGFLVALVQAELFAARAAHGLVAQLATRPTPERWRDILAGALDDDALRLGFHDPATGRFRDAGGAAVSPPADGARAFVPVNRDGRPVAAMVIDATLAEDPELVRAAASATLLAVENGALEGELRASRVRILEAGHAERRRIERDLHDSAQQRLVALRIHLQLAHDQLEEDHGREVLERLGDEVDEAIDDLRDVAHGLYPQVLSQAGVRAALQAVAGRSAIPVRVRDRGLGRQAEALETTVYFCCLEALQNAAKHAGPRATVDVELDRVDGHVRFSVRDDGAGFDPSAVRPGTGLTNLADRVAAAGGTLRVDTSPGRGTRVSAELPV